MINESCEDVKEDMRNPSDSCLRSAFFNVLLLTLGKLKTFDEIHKFCMNHENKLAAYEMIRSTPSILSTGLSVDGDALNLYPADVEQSSVIYPVAVTGDGNCLPYTGSVLAFGQENYGQEMRVRIVFELAIHKDLYLSNEHLRAGLAEDGTINDFPIAFAMYSEKCVPGILLNKETVTEIYQNEVIDACNDKSYIVHGHLANVCSSKCSWKSSFFSVSLTRKCKCSKRFTSFDNAKTWLQWDNTIFNVDIKKEGHER